MRFSTIQIRDGVKAGRMFGVVFNVKFIGND